MGRLAAVFLCTTLVLGDGVIALQIHPGGGAKMRFKDLWIRDLTAR